MNKAAVNILIQVDQGTYFSWTLIYCSRSPNYMFLQLKNIYVDTDTDLVYMWIKFSLELFLNVIGRAYFVSASS